MRPRSVSPSALVSRVSLLALASLGACAAEGARPVRTSPTLVATGEALPAGYLRDTRGDDPLVALTNAAGETELHDLAGLVAPPIPGFERATLRALRRAPDGSVWVCHDEGAAVRIGDAWTSHPFASFDVPEDLAGGCASLDARSATDVYLSVGANLCSWDGAAWDCFPFGTARSVTLSPGNLWFVRPSARFDDLTVIDTISRATPALVRLGDVGSTEALVPVPGADEVVVVGTSLGARTLRRASTDGTFVAIAASDVVPIGPTESYLLVAGAFPALECADLVCGAAAEWSELLVMHETGGAATEVGHLSVDGPGGVPWRGLLVGGALFVESETGLLTLP